MNISKQTNNIVNVLLENNGYDIDAHVFNDI